MNFDFYKLSADPFRMDPDHRFFYASQTHKTALAYLQYGLQQGEGFLVLTGEVGAGKSTLIGHLLSELDPESLKVVRIASANLDEEGMLRLIAHSLDGNADGDRGRLLVSIRESLDRHIRQGHRVLLLVDEAQSLSVATLEELRMLMSLSGEGGVQCFLVGQPQLTDLLALPECQQAAQRVIASCHLTALPKSEVFNYIQHRLQIAGWQGRPRLAPHIADHVYQATGGIPRLINMVLSRLLLMGSLEQSEDLGVQDVKSVIEDLETEVVGLGKSVSIKSVGQEGAAQTAVPASPAIDNQQLGEFDQRLTEIETVLTKIIDAMTVLLVMRHGGTKDSEQAEQQSQEIP